MAFSLIAGAISTALFAGSALATTIIGSVLTFAARTALSYITRKRRPKQTAIQGQVQFGGDIPATILFGTRNTKGHRIFYAKYGAGNKFNADVFWLADGWNDGLEPFVYVYAEKHTLIAQTPIGNEHARYTIDGFSDAIIVRFYDGRPGQLADSELIAATSGLENRWLATDTCDNQAYVVVSREYRSDLFSKGRPEIEFILRGLREYDPRKDDTVAGGEGTHRLNDRSTWEHSRNPAVHRINFLLGHKGLVSGEVLVGVGKSINQIDLSSHMLSANISDTTRTVGERAIPTYQCDMWVSADEDHLQVLEDIEDSMAGSAVNRASLDGVVAGAPQVPVLTLTRADIRTDETEKWKYRQSNTNSFNSLSGQFTSVESGYRPESLKVVTSAEDVAQDGKKRPVGNDLLQICDPDIAQYVQTIRYRQNRKAARRSVPVSRRVGLKVLVEEWVVFDGVTYALKRVKIDKYFRFSWELAETGPDIYGEGGIAAGPIIPPTVSPANPALISTLANFTIAVGLIEGVNGAQMPALEFGWDDPEDPTITAAVIEYRKVGTTTPVFTHIEELSDGVTGALTTNGVGSDTAYEARATIRTRPDRLKVWTHPWVATSVATSPIKVNLREIQEDAIGRFKALQLQMNQIETRIIQIGTAQVTSELSNYTTISETVEQVGQSRASIRQEQLVRASGDAAIAGRVDIVEVDVDANAAAIATEATARADGDTANATSILNVSARVDTAEDDISSNAAAIATEATARATGDSANASSIATVSARVDTAESNISSNAADIGTEATARANGDSANATSISNVSARVDTAESDISSNAAAIATEATARANGDSANATSISNVAARVDTAEDDISANASAITTEQTARADGDTANADAITAAVSRIDDAEDDITANAGAISSLGTTVSSLGDDVTANAAAITAVNSRVDDTETDITANAGAISSLSSTVSDLDGDVTANAAAISAVNVEVGNATAGGLFKIEAEAGVGSVLARIVMYVRADLGDAFEEAGSIYEVYDDGGTIKSRILMNADQFVITDGSNESLPLVFEGGELKLQVANIGTVTAGLLQSPDGLTEFNLATGTLTFSEAI